MDLAELLLGSLSRAPWGWTLLGVIGVTLLKIWPVLQLQAENAKIQLRGEHRDDLHNCNQRLDEMSDKLDAVTSQMHQLDLKLVGTVTAYRILHDDQTVNNPDNPALLQARAAFQATWDGPVFGKGISVL